MLFAFDPRHTALLLLGGDKTDDPRWYDRFVPIADELFDQHLRQLEDKRKKQEQAAEKEEDVIDRRGRSTKQRIMYMAKNFRVLREKMSPESRERSRTLAARYRAEMPLHELREALEITQMHLAELLKVKQSAVSKMERRTDMYISTLHHFIKAMGGELKIIANFPDGAVEINQFQAAKRAAAVGSRR